MNKVTPITDLRSPRERLGQRSCPAAVQYAWVLGLNDNGAWIEFTESPSPSFPLGRHWQEFKVFGRC